MDHRGTIIRPPSEADSILLQVTLGCSHNRCAFCGAYLDKPFAIKDPAAVRRDLDFASAHCARQRRLFLCDGDALVLPQSRLLALLADIRARLPWVTRVGSYARAAGLARKSDADLAALRDAGLGIVYMGLESGDDAVLSSMNKGETAALIVEQGRRARAAGIKLNVTILNGLGGVAGSLAHARATADALSAMQPDQIAALSLMLIPGTPLHARHRQGGFTLPDSLGILRELREMIAHLDLPRALFLANHASNYLPLKVRLPSGKASALEQLDQAIAGLTPLRPEGMRRL
ncbi:radical SAM protein [Pseudodesulfovibrio sp.]|uniref:radical SAM protein n=1 Tax=Pseudodesulfovibrio sp. TaxID=2035812 RepID=UPI00261766F0|nr:radical SAM protein [Pseudodesulfovibrio sp.]MDD3311279.1 radical SAM protein [Pseudodesulfovibrio sp.]